MKAWATRRTVDGRPPTFVSYHNLSLPVGRYPLLTSLFHFCGRTWSSRRDHVLLKLNRRYAIFLSTPLLCPGVCYADVNQVERNADNYDVLCTDRRVRCTIRQQNLWKTYCRRRDIYRIAHCDLRAQCQEWNGRVDQPRLNDNPQDFAEVCLLLDLVRVFLDRKLRSRRWSSSIFDTPDSDNNHNCKKWSSILHQIHPSKKTHLSYTTWVSQ